MVALRKLTQNFVATQVDDEILIVDLDGGELFSLSGTARTLWEAIDGTRTESDLASLMALRHEGDTLTIGRDVADLVREFERAALVEKA